MLTCRLGNGSDAVVILMRYYSTAKNGLGSAICKQKYVIFFNAPSFHHVFCGRIELLRFFSVEFLVKLAMLINVNFVGLCLQRNESLACVHSHACLLILNSLSRKERVPDGDVVFMMKAKDNRNARQAFNSVHCCTSVCSWQV